MTANSQIILLDFLPAAKNNLEPKKIVEKYESQVGN
jgi:hypothetical protein